MTPLLKTRSTSTVGFPRESIIWRPITSSIILILLYLIFCEIDRKGTRILPAGKEEKARSYSLPHSAEGKFNLRGAKIVLSVEMGPWLPILLGYRVPIFIIPIRAVRLHHLQALAEIVEEIAKLDRRARTE